MEMTLVNAMSREFTLREYLSQVKHQYDYVIIDCMPSLGMITINALAEADSVIVPVQAQYLPAKGMTQLMKLLFGILKADTGTISLLGEKIDPTGRNAVFKKVGNIIETPVFYKNLTARENLEIHCEYLGSSNLKQDIGDILLLVGLSDTGKKKVGEFSLGMKQRSGIGACAD